MDVSFGRVSSAGICLCHLLHVGISLCTAMQVPEQAEGQCADEFSVLKKPFSFFPFFPLKRLRNLLLTEGAESFFFHFKFPKHWFKRTLSCTLF